MEIIVPLGLREGSGLQQSRFMTLRDGVLPGLLKLPLTLRVQCKCMKSYRILKPVVLVVSHRQGDLNMYSSYRQPRVSLLRSDRLEEAEVPRIADRHLVLTRGRRHLISDGDTGGRTSTDPCKSGARQGFEYTRQALFKSASRRLGALGVMHSRDQITTPVDMLLPVRNIHRGIQRMRRKIVALGNMKLRRAVVIYMGHRQVRSLRGLFRSDDTACSFVRRMSSVRRRVGQHRRYALEPGPCPACSGNCPSGPLSGAGYRGFRRHGLRRRRQGPPHEFCPQHRHAYQRRHCRSPLLPALPGIRQILEPGLRSVVQRLGDPCTRMFADEQWKRRYEHTCHGAADSGSPITTASSDCIQAMQGKQL